MNQQETKQTKNTFLPHLVELRKRLTLIIEEEINKKYRTHNYQLE